MDDWESGTSMEEIKKAMDRKEPEDSKSASLSCYTTYEIEYWAWPEGARIKTEGRFEMAGKNREDVIIAAQRRWPEMHITSCEAI